MLLDSCGYHVFSLGRANLLFSEGVSLMASMNAFEDDHAPAYRNLRWRNGERKQKKELAWQFNMILCKQ